VQCPGTGVPWSKRERLLKEAQLLELHCAEGENQQKRDIRGAGSGGMLGGAGSVELAFVGKGGVSKRRRIGNPKTKKPQRTGAPGETQIAENVKKG